MRCGTRSRGGKARLLSTADARGERQFRVVTVNYGGNAETSTSGNKRSARSFERIIESEVGVMTFG